MKTTKRLTVSLAISILCSSALAQESITPIPFPKTHSAGKPKIDSKIRELNKQQKADADDCVGDDSSHEIETTPEVIWDTLSIYSVVVREDDACGGVHPNASSSTTTFDATTGELYSPDKLYQIRTSTNPGFPEKAPFDEEVGAAVVDALIDARAPFEDDDDCLLRIKEAGPTDERITYAELGLGKDGMHIFVNPPRVMLACYNDIVLPYSKLAPYLNKEEASRLKLKLPAVAEANVPGQDLFPHPDLSKNQIRRDAIIRVLSHGWSRKDKQTLAELLKAKDEYLSATARNEVIDDGIPSSLIKTITRDNDEEDFLDTLLELDKGFAQHNSYEVSQVDAELNRKYQMLQRGDEVLWEASLTVTKTGIRETERLWLAYRDAWMRLIAAKAPDTTPASVLFELTQARLSQLSDLAEETKPAGKLR